MDKLYSDIIEQSISSWAEHRHIQALGQEGFRPNVYSRIHHLVTLRVTMEESRLQGKMLYCSIDDFKNTFDIPRNELWKRMIEIGMPLEYRATVAQMYDHVWCQLKMHSVFPEVFEQHGVKKPTLSHSLVCIDNGRNSK